MEKEQGSVLEKELTILKEPKRYMVVMHNDDFTTFEFVVFVLLTVFHKSGTDAELLTQQIHNNGKAVVGIYSYDIALSKKTKAMDLARKDGFPLRLSIAPED